MEQVEGAVSRSWDDHSLPQTVPIMVAMLVSMADSTRIVHVARSAPKADGCVTYTSALEYDDASTHHSAAHVHLQACCQGQRDMHMHVACTCMWCGRAVGAHRERH